MSSGTRRRTVAASISTAAAATAGWQHREQQQQKYMTGIDNILLSPGAPRLPSRLLAHSAARYEVSDLPRFMARGDEIPRVHQRVLLGRGSGVRALLATCVRSPCISKFSGNPRRSLFGGGALPQWNVFGGWHREQRPGPGEILYFIFGSGGPESVCASQSAPREIMDYLGRELQQAVVS